MHSIKPTILALTALLGCFTCHAQSLKDDLIRIDGALEMAEDFDASHSTRVESIQNRLQSSNLSLYDQYKLYDELYDTEFSYKFDLAKDALEKRSASQKGLATRTRFWSRPSTRHIFCALPECILNQSWQHPRLTLPPSTTMLL